MIDYLENGTLIVHPKLGECKVIGVETIQNERYYIIEETKSPFNKVTASDKLLKASRFINESNKNRLFRT